MNKLLSICWLVFVQWPRGLWLHTRLVLAGLPGGACGVIL